MAAWGCGSSGLRSVAAAVFLLCLLTTGANGWGIVQFHGSRNCSSDSVSFARLCTANKCCSAISYSPADQSQSAIGAKGQCTGGRVVGMLYAAYDCSGQVISTFDVQELTSDDIQSARCSLVGAHDSAMGDCSGGAAMQFAWRMLLFTLYFVL